MLPQLPKKVGILSILIIPNLTWLEVVERPLSKYEFLRGRQNETVVKELCVASTSASENFRFKPPYKMADHGSTEIVINWIDGHLEYRDLHMVLNEAVACFAHLYAYGVSKCTFLAGLTARPIHNLEDVNCHPPDFQSRALMYRALSQVSQILLRNQNRAFRLRLVDILFAEERFRPMPCRYDTSYCRFCCSPINRPCTLPTQSLCSCYNGN